MKNNGNKVCDRISAIRRVAGQRGGLATVARHGIGHMKVIGLKGARVFHLRYKLVPFGQDDFAIVDRETNLTKAFLSGMPFEG